MVTKLSMIFKLKVKRGPTHQFLGLLFEFNYASGDVMITQPDYVSKIIGDINYRVAETSHTAELFNIDCNAEKLRKEESSFRVYFIRNQSHFEVKFAIKLLSEV